MGGLNENQITGKEDEEGGAPAKARKATPRPSRVTGSPAGDVLQDGGEESAGGTASPVAVTPAHRLLAALLAAGTVAPLDEGGVPVPGRPPGLGGQPLRIHQNGGEVHFHADADGLKAAVPKADMWAIWNELQHLGRRQYLDRVSGTLLTLVTRLTTKDGGDFVELYANLVACKPTYGPVFTKLDQTVGQ